VILWLEEDEMPPAFPEPVGFWTVNPQAGVGYWRLFGDPHASARTGIFADGGRVFVSETAANFMEVRSHKINLRLDLESRRKPIGFCPAKSQQPTYAFVLPRWSKGNNAAVLSNCVFGAVHLMHHTQASGYVER
jgi:hypothetical protein